MIMTFNTHQVPGRAQLSGAQSCVLDFPKLMSWTALTDNYITLS